MSGAGLKVPKQALEVEVRLRDVGTRRVELFVAEQSPRDLRPESVLDRFEDDEPFLPGRDVEDGAWMLVNKDAVVWAAVPQDAATLSLDEELFDHRRRVAIELLGSEPLEGECLYSAPAARARVVDYLNRPGRLVWLYRDDGLALVGKRWIVRVLER